MFQNSSCSAGPDFDPYCAAQGLQGLAAAQGLQGFDAAHGLQGFAAAQGLQGFEAAQGLHGFEAAHGLHGLHGLAAPQRPFGLQGKQAATQLAGMIPSFTPAATAPATPRPAMITIAVVLRRFFFGGGLPPPDTFSCSITLSLLRLGLFRKPLARSVKPMFAAGHSESKHVLHWAEHSSSNPGVKQRLHDRVLNV